MEEQNIRLNDGDNLTDCETLVKQPHAIKRSPLKPIVPSNNSLMSRNIITVTNEFLGKQTISNEIPNNSENVALIPISCTTIIKNNKATDDIAVAPHSRIPLQISPNNAENVEIEQLDRAFK